MNDTIKAYLATIGRKGGKAGKGQAKARTSQQARDAVKTRWAKVRKDREAPNQSPVEADQWDDQ